MKKLELGSRISIPGIQKSHGLEKHTLVDFSVGYDGCVYLLFSACPPERIQGMFVNPTAETGYTAVVLAVDLWDSFALLNETACDLGIQTPNLHFIQPIDDGFFLLGARAALHKNGEPDKNALILSKSGVLRSSFCLGDGIQRCMVLEDGRIITAYFDEGVFGNNGWDRPVGESGVIVWNSRGEPVWKNTRYSICDCYAMNIDESSRLWFYYYPDFKLVGTNFSRDIVMDPKLSGASFFAFNRIQTLLLFAGSYSDSSLRLFPLKGETLGKGEPLEATADGRPIGEFRCSFRGSKLLFLTRDGDLYGYDFLQ